MPEAYEPGYDAPSPSLADETRLDSLELKEDSRFDYGFDFGDDWWNEIKVMAIDDKVPQGKFAKVTKEIGKRPAAICEL